jgi:bacterioferritin-associated ferredoxin
MYVCLCRAVTNTTVHQAVEAGATTGRKVGESCGAGTVCGRCRRSIFSIIRAWQGAQGARLPSGPTPQRAIAAATDWQGRQDRRRGVDSPTDEQSRPSRPPAHSNGTDSTGTTSPTT